MRLNQKVVTQPFSSFVLIAWQCRHAPNTIKFYLQVCPKSKYHNLYMWAKGKLHHNPIFWHVQSSNKFYFFVVGQSNWLLANFGCPISSPNPCLPLSLQLTNRTQQIGTINNDPILDCKQFWDLNDIREHEGEPKFGNLWVHIG